MRPRGNRGDSAKGRVNDSTRQRVNMSTHGCYTGTKFGRRMQLPYAPIQVQNVLCFAMQVYNWWKTASSPQSAARICFVVTVTASMPVRHSLQLSLLIQLCVVIVEYRYSTIYSLASDHRTLNGDVFGCNWYIH